MKFIYADAMDVIDPLYDFLKDRNADTRIVHLDDEYPHEFLKRAPYDGILVSRGIVGDIYHQGKYSGSQMMRFHREGARKFLRYPEKKFPGSLVFGDCGAFTYRNEKVPPYTPDDTMEFYGNGRFTHGCSVDHIIFDFDEGKGRARKDMPQAILDRFDLTLALADEFYALGRREKGFTPVGVIQGWSATSMARAADYLVRMGYTYLAVGGLVPLSVAQIHQALAAIRAAIPPRVRLHLLGFGKIENLTEFARYGITSFDTTSPLIRAFKDAVKNYIARDEDGELSYYTAIRVPQSRENNKLKAKAREGSLHQETALKLETVALDAIRKYDAGKLSVEKALDYTLEYWKALNWTDKQSAATKARAIKKQREVYRRTLVDRPWENCECRVCQEGGIETLLFRTSNRNKRRGMHNLHVFYQHLLAYRSATHETASISRIDPAAGAKRKGRVLRVSRV